MRQSMSMNYNANSSEEGCETDTGNHDLRFDFDSDLYEEQDLFEANERREHKERSNQKNGRAEVSGRVMHHRSQRARIWNIKPGINGQSKANILRLTFNGCAVANF